MTSSPKASAHRTIALLADRFDELYQQTILTVMEEAAQQRGASVLAFAAGIPGGRHRGDARRALMLELVSDKTADAVILLAGTMVNELGLAGLNSLVERTRGLPTCSISVEVPEVPSIVVDNAAGIDQAMRHLVEHHGCRRIAFVRGPQKNKEAEARFEAYQTALAKSGVSFERELVCQGDFLSHSGEAAAKSLMALEQPPEAIFCANDEMAIGAARALVKAKVRVPEEVRVVGFDGIDVAGLANPPLTTVRQPLADLAVMAVRTVMEQLHGRKPPLMQTLETHLVVRESCGCLLQLTSTGQSQFAEESTAHNGVKTATGAEGFSASFQRFRQPLHAELARAARGEFTSLGDWDAQLRAGLDAQVRGEGPVFVQALAQFVGRVAEQEGDISRFQDVITAFRRFALPCCGEDHKLRTQIENVLQEARLVVTHATERAHGQRRIELERLAVKWSAVCAALTGSFSLDALAKAFCSELPRLDVSAAYLIAYEPKADAAKALPPISRLLAGFDRTEKLWIDKPEEATFSTIDVLPRELLSRRNQQLTVLPLFHDELDLGYCLLELRGGSGASIEGLRAHLSIALRVCQACSTT